MYSNVFIATPRAENLKFPLLARSKVDETVVLFTGMNAGFVVSPPKNNPATAFHEIGYDGGEERGIYWIDCAKSSNWEILPSGSSVTLFQK